MAKYREPGGERWYDSPNAPIVVTVILLFIAYGMYLAVQEFRSV
jgi:hypothetical protein